MFNMIMLFLHGAVVGSSTVILLQGASIAPWLHYLLILLNLTSAIAIMTTSCESERDTRRLM